MTPNSSKIKRLAELVFKRKQNGFTPIPIILGAGASISSGASSMKAIVTSIVGRYDLRKFYSALDQLDETSRTALLWDHLNAATPSPGYSALVWLLKSGYFDIVFTTNHDTLLENSLSENGLRYGQDFAVAIVGRDLEDAIISQLRGVGPRIKVIKLHGCISIRKCAFTPREIMDFQPTVEQLIREHLAYGAVIVGHGMRDMDLNRCFTKKSGAIWYIGPRAPRPSEPISNILQSIPSTTISGNSATFDSFFVSLRDQVAILESRRISS